MRRVERCPGVLWRRSLGRVLALAPDGDVVELSDAAAAIWEALGSPTDPRDLVADLAGLYDVPEVRIRDSVDSVLADLEQRQLVQSDVP